MRTDQNLARKSFRHSDSWKEDAARAQAQPDIDSRLEGYEVRPDGQVVVHSLSGNERNRLFMNRGGKDFENASTVSGLDNPADSRGWVLLDYDHDGWQDIAVVNANAPLLNLYHNNIAASGAQNGMIALRLVGGGGLGFACRDGYGAVVEVGLADGTKLKREHRCGEGYSSQNSATMVIGIGEHRKVASVQVRWPSGKISKIQGIAEGTLLTAFEDRTVGAFTQSQYRNIHKPLATVPAERKRFPLAKTSREKVQVYTTTATWCAACISHLPALAQLEQEGVELFGIPIDPKDDSAKLADYVEEKKPPYQMLAGTSADEKRAMIEFIARELRTENPPLPSTVITDSIGNVLEVIQGIPTVSQVRRWSLP